MRVAYVCADPGVPVFGCKGCSVHVQEVLREFVRRGIDVDLFAASLGGAAPPDLATIRVHTISVARSQSPEDREGVILEANGAATRLLAAAGPFDLVYERHALFAHAAMNYAAQAQIAGVLEVNAPLVEEQARFRTLVRREQAESAARCSIRRAAAIVAVSQGAADYAIALRGSGHGVAVIPNGVNPERFAAPVIPRPTGRPFTVGFLGTLKPWHGVELLIEAHARLRRLVSDARLLVVGDGPLRESLEAMSEQLCGPGAVEFVGSVSPSEVPWQLARMDCAVAPYAIVDGFYFSPLKVLEYMAAGLPIVASRVGQICDMLEHGRTGHLVTPGDVPDLVEALVQLHADPDAARRLGAAAQRAAADRYSWRGVVDRILALARDAEATTPSLNNLPASPTARRTA